MATFNWRMNRYKAGRMTEKERGYFELRSCAKKIRYKIEPSCTLSQRAYHCPVCDGWHKTTKQPEPD